MNPLDHPHNPGRIPQRESGLIDWGLDEPDPNPAVQAELLVRVAHDSDRILEVLHTHTPNLGLTDRAVTRPSTNNRSNAMNNVSIIGRLTADPEMHAYEQDGQTKPLARFRLAVDRPGRPETDFVNVVAFGPTATALCDHVGKGRRVAVEGRIRSNEWETSGGERRYGIELAASRVDFLERVKQAEETLDQLTQRDSRSVETTMQRDEP